MTEQAEVVLDREIFAEAQMMMGEKFPTMVQYFLEDAEDYISSIREGISLVDAKKITSPAHTLKSSAQQIGAVRMSGLASMLEEISRERAEDGRNDMSQLPDLLFKLEIAFAETKEALKNVT